MEKLADSLIIFGAKYLLVLLIGIALWYFLKQPQDKQRRLAVFGLTTCIVAFVMARIATQFYYDPRPFVAGNFVPLVPHAPDNGFPSDHALLSSSIAVAIFYFNRKIGLLLAVLAVLVGTSRVMAGVHHPVDILGSIIISAAAAFLVHMVIMPKVINSRIYNYYFK